MKKLLTAMLIPGLFAIGCKKDSKVSPPLTTNAKKYKVTFTVPAFTQTVTNLSAKKGTVLMANLKGSRTLATDTSALAQAFSRYIYVVYDASGNEVKRIIRYATSPVTEDYYHEDNKYYNVPETPGLQGINPVNQPYNVITDSLAAGNYTIVVAGSNDRIELNNWDSNREQEWPLYYPLKPVSTDNVYFTKAAVFVADGLDLQPRSNEIFLGKIRITVNNQDSQQNITVNRIVGQLEVNIEDAIPNNVAYLGVIRINEDGGYLLYDETPFGTTSLPDEDWEGDYERNIITTADHGKTNYKTDRFVLNTITPIPVQIVAYDINNNVVAQATVNNVQMYKNKRTILTGKLFGPAQTQFSIHANQAWDPNVTTVHF